MGKEIRDGEISADIAAVVSDNLERSGLFKPVDKGAFLQKPKSLQVQPRFSDWRVINAQALVNGSVKLQPDGRLRVEFRLWDVFAEAQMTAWRISPSQTTGVVSPILFRMRSISG